MQHIKTKSRQGTRALSFLLAATMLTSSISSCDVMKWLATPSTTTTVSHSPSDAAEKDIDGVVNGHPFIDLGLPSGTLWATTNIGAIASHDFGELIAWGELHEKKEFSWQSYRLTDREGNLIMYNFDDSQTILRPDMDAASKLWGPKWRMASRSEMEELIRCCTVQWVTKNGHHGALFTGPNGKSIFLPGAGCSSSDARPVGGNHCDYWSGSRNTTTRPQWAGYLFVGKEGLEVKFYENDRYIGRSVRPVLNNKRRR